MAILSPSIRTFLIFLISKDSFATKLDMRIQNKCIYIFEIWKTFDEAETICRHEHAGLMIIENQEEFNTIAEIPFTYEFWIGLNKTADGKWYWTNGREFLNNSWWNQIQPGSYDHAIFQNGYLIQKSRTVPSVFICEDVAYAPFPVNITGDISGLCGVEIMPNCDGLPCVNICHSYPGCVMFAPMANLCINIKNSTDQSTCTINLRSNAQFYRVGLKC